VSAAAYAEENQRALVAELGRISALLEAALAGEPSHDPPGAEAPALGALAAAFGLSAFERDLLLLVAGAELDAALGRLCDEATGGGPSFGLALAALPGAHWSALTPPAPLRRWHMLEPEPGAPLTTGRLRIDERVLHHLAGLDYLDGQLEPLLSRVPAPATLPPSQQHAAALLRGSAGLAVLVGADAETRRAVAAAAYAPQGRPVHALPAAELPLTATERAPLARRWEREAALGAGMLVLELDDGAEPAVRARASAFADALDAPAIVSAGEPPPPGRRPAAHVAVHRPRYAEQRELWRSALGDRAGALNGTVDRLAGHFDLGAGAIGAAAGQGGDDPGALWEACRAQARPRFGGLAERLDPVAGWDDLVLPEPERDLLEEVVAQVRGRSLVHDGWGFAGQSTRGLGISALFEGPSGTGKTMAAEVLARELDLDLYRIDLSQVVSKYIGETERNLRAVFDAAESGAAVLLFDEADALFGSRTEVRDSHDRYANIEVSYLLQRMESYRGLAILTTNAKDAIDAAFMRRLRFVVRFPFPGAPEREEIWRRAFPSPTPTDGLDPAALSRLSLSGGNIRSIALGAAFLAADAGEPVRMGHVARVARRECVKLGRPISDTDVAAWR
jgi:ATPase family associated with various cellular activities (AAA)